MSAVLPHNTTTTQHCSQIIIRAYRCKKCHVFVTLKAFYRFLIVCRYRLWHQELFWMNHLTWMNQMTLLGFVQLSFHCQSRDSVKCLLGFDHWLNVFIHMNMIIDHWQCFHSYEHDYFWLHRGAAPEARGERRVDSQDDAGESQGEMRPACGWYDGFTFCHHLLSFQTRKVIVHSVLGEQLMRESNWYFHLWVN